MATVIQNEIDDYDAYYQPNPDIPNDLETPTDNLHFMIGSKLKEISFAELLENNPVLFARFHIRVSEFMSDLLPTSGIPLPGGQRIAYSAINMVSFQIHTFQRNLSNGSTDCSLSISEDQLRVS